MKKLKDWFENAQYALIFAIILPIFIFVLSLPFQIFIIFDNKYPELELLITFPFFMALICPIFYQVYLKLKGYPISFFWEYINEDRGFRNILLKSGHYKDNSLSKLKFLKRYILDILSDVAVTIGGFFSVMFFGFLIGVLSFELWTLFFPSITLEKFINYFF